MAQLALTDKNRPEGRLIEPKPDHLSFGRLCLCADRVFAQRQSRSEFKPERVVAEGGGVNNSVGVEGCWGGLTTVSRNGTRNPGLCDGMGFTPLRPPGETRALAAVALCSFRSLAAMFALLRISGSGLHPSDFGLSASGSGVFNNCGPKGKKGTAVDPCTRMLVL